MDLDLSVERLLLPFCVVKQELRDLVKQRYSGPAYLHLLALVP